MNSSDLDKCRPRGNTTLPHRPQCRATNANAILNDQGEPLSHTKLIKNPDTHTIWSHSAANEFGRLAQGVGTRIKGTNTIFFIPKSKVPKGRTVTCAHFVCDIRPQKDETHRTRLTVGGNLISYPGDVSTRTADLPLVKSLINHVLSTPRAKFMTMDTGNFYLNTPMERHEHMRVNISQIPDEIIAQYDLI